MKTRKRIKKTAQLIISLTALCAASMSFSSGYFGGSLSKVDMEYDYSDYDVSPTALNLRIGSQFDENFAGEVRVGFGLSGDSDYWDDETEIDKWLGVYLKAGSQLGENIYPYIIIGQTKGTVRYLGEKDSEDDTSLGLGVDINASDSTKFTIEYMRYMELDELDVNGLSIGFTADF
jgi:hypothetical protein